MIKKTILVGRQDSDPDGRFVGYQAEKQQGTAKVVLLDYLRKGKARIAANRRPSPFDLPRYAYDEGRRGGLLPA
ncbi:MAG TPA: hypothetical protein VLV54_07555, partial [Thermoanaerobaculia bacterium]|nr:hypothetical protein [Thermoanaerobaculia bacterium]